MNRLTLNFERQISSEPILTLNFQQPSRRCKSCQRGEEKRKDYDFLFKINFVEHLDSGICATDAAFDNCINKLLFSMRKKEWKDIIDGAALKHKRLVEKDRHSNKHVALFTKLIAKISITLLK